MRLIIKIALGVIAAGIIGLISFLFYMGVFSTPEVTEMETGPYTIVYEEFIGDYKKSGQVFERVGKAMEKEGIKTTRGFGIYFDDPKMVPADKLRSHCGLVIEGDNLKMVPELKKKYNIQVIDKSNRIVIEFPIKNMLSYVIGPMKCYPAFSEYSKEKGYKVDSPGYELYDMQSKKILFMMDIEK
ncbi:MAG: hypothetical protein JW871_04230 [Endomicrobiales bacterium]|nr:hypothetical protein [Endomicrobiales bacterium]